MVARNFAAILVVAALALALASDIQSDGACAVPSSIGLVEEIEESGLVQQKAVRHSTLPNPKCRKRGKGLGEMCILNTEECANADISQCPCRDGLTCVATFNSTEACCGTCRAKDGQFCRSDDWCVGGYCAGNLGKGGLCKTRTGGFSINLIDTSNGAADAYPEFKLAFEKAAARYADIIKGQVIDISDLVVDILWSVEPIDGPSNILAYAGPTSGKAYVVEHYGIRVLPTAGIMVFDIDDLLQPNIAPLAEALILHEMAHVLGIGVLQETSVVISPIPGLPPPYDMTDCEKSGGVDGRYNSLDGYATDAYLAAKGYLPTGLQNGNFTRTRLPPIETDFGKGTQCSHWDEATLNNELMTGIFNCEFAKTPEECAAKTRLSIITIGGFEDLGYAVDYDQADSYSVPAEEEVLAAGRKSPGFVIDEHIVSPAVEVVMASPGGRVDPGAARRHAQTEIENFRKKYATKGD